MEQQMINAINTKNIQLLYKLLKKGVNINIQNKYGQTVLILASQINNRQLLLEVLKYDNVDLELSTSSAYVNNYKCNKFNFINTYEETALWWACKRNNIDIVKILLFYGAKVNNNKIGTSPLIEACKNGYFEIVKLLVINNADVNYICFNKMEYDYIFALKEAVRYKYNNIVEYLLKKEINFYVEECDTTVFEIAVIRKYVNIFKLLINKVEDNIDDYKKVFEKCLIIACKIESKTIIEIMINLKIDINCSDIDGNTPLIILCKIRNNFLIKMILEENIDLLKTNIYGENALSILTTNQNNEILDIIKNKVSNIINDK